jgi:hypothetical protein
MAAIQSSDLGDGVFWMTGRIETFNERSVKFGVITLNVTVGQGGGC